MTGLKEAQRERQRVALEKVLAERSYHWWADEDVDAIIDAVENPEGE